MYHFTIAQILQVDSELHRISLRIDSSDDVVGHIDTEAMEWQFVQPLSQTLQRAVPKTGENIRSLRINTEHALNHVAGMHYYPNVGDIIFVAVWLQDMPNATSVYQAMNKPVLILGQITTNPSHINQHDWMILDRSGAKFHINHTWLDGQNRIVVGDKTISPPTGHITIVGNRVVELSGRRFLPFGAYSHFLEKGLALGANSNNPPVVFETEYDDGINIKAWNELFTRDIGSTQGYDTIYDPDLTQSRSPKGEGKFFLEPPCPLPEENMKMHDSGWKRLIREDASEQRFLHSRTELFGENFKNLSFAPDNKQADGSDLDTGFDSTERTVIHDHSLEGMETKFYSDGVSIYGQRIMDGFQEIVMDGYLLVIPAEAKTMVSEVDTLMAATSGKYIIKVGALTLTMDGSTVDVS